MMHGLILALREQGLLPPGPLAAPAISMSRGQCGSALIGTADKLLVHVKFSDCGGTLADEHSRQKLAEARFRALVPQAIGQGRTADGLDWLASRAFSIRMPKAIPDDAAMLSGLRSLLTAPPAAAAPAPEFDSDDIIDRLRAAGRRWGAPPCMLDRLTPSLQDDIHLLPRNPQHGDLWTGNLGLADGRLVVFDWEDYGRLQIPGFDLHTLLAALPRPRSRGASERRRRFEAMAVGWCGLDAQGFDQLRPVHALAFRLLKDRYGRSVRQRIDAGWSASQPSRPAGRFSPDG
jgi:hypothetical protein